MKSLKLLVCFIVILKSFDDVHCDCTLTLQNDFGRPSPVLIRNGAYLSPDSSGDISIRQMEAIKVACPGTYNYVTLANNETSPGFGSYSAWDAHCITGSTFHVSRWMGAFRNLICKTHPVCTTEDMQTDCRGKGRMHRVGYKVKGKFYSLYEVCFDKKLLTTYYVKHGLTPQSNIQPYGSTRPPFIGGSLFANVNMAELYKTENQKARLDSILGASMSEQYVTKNQFLTRGHMAAKGDFTLSAEMYATFHYANTAPQWLSANAGWSTLEDAVRERVERLGKPVTVYTGAHGVFTLPDAKGTQKHIYLAVDKDNNGILPVPMYFFKVIYDPQNKTALAIMSINSAFYDRNKIKELTFCNDICDRNRNYNWLKLRDNREKTNFCCNYEQFARKVTYFPILDVVGEFY